MAQIKKDVHKDKDITIVNVSGELLFEQIVQVLEDFYKSDFTLKLLWDLSHADLSALTNSHIEKIISYAKSKSHLREGGKTAIVALKDIDYGVSRMYEILSELKEHPVSHSVFRNRDEALKWLKE
jgi:hypothetical protein